MNLLVVRKRWYGFLIWILCGIVGHLILILLLFGIGFQANQQQANPAAKPWAGLLLFPFILGIGFLAKFFDSRNWVFRPREIVVLPMTDGTRVDLRNIKSITIQASGNCEIWRIEKNDGGEPEVGVFRQTKHSWLASATPEDEDVLDRAFQFGGLPSPSSVHRSYSRNNPNSPTAGV